MRSLNGSGAKPNLDYQNQVYPVDLKISSSGPFVILPPTTAATSATSLEGCHNRNHGQLQSTVTTSDKEVLGHPGSNFASTRSAIDVFGIVT